MADMRENYWHDGRLTRVRQSSNASCTTYAYPAWSSKAITTSGHSTPPVAPTPLISSAASSTVSPRTSTGCREVVTAQHTFDNSTPVCPVQLRAFTPHAARHPHCFTSACAGHCIQYANRSHGWPAICHVVPGIDLALRRSGMLPMAICTLFAWLEWRVALGSKDDEHMVFIASSR